MVRPVADDTLGRVEHQLADGRAAALQPRTASCASRSTTMGRTSDLLRTETQALVTALRAPQVRGRWGEMQLRRVVEVAGMVEHCDFDEQAPLRHRRRTLRPDLVVRLAGGKNVVVDAKVPFAGYIDAMNTHDDAVASRDSPHMPATTHPRRRSWPPRPTGNALAPTRSSWCCSCPLSRSCPPRSSRTRRCSSTPSSATSSSPPRNTLVAMLRTVAYTWRQDALDRRTRSRCSTLGRELHQRLGTMGGHLEQARATRSTARSSRSTSRSLPLRAGSSSRPGGSPISRITDEELAAPCPDRPRSATAQAAELIDRSRATSTAGDESQRHTSASRRVADCPDHAEPCTVGRCRRTPTPRAWGRRQRCTGEPSARSWSAHRAQAMAGSLGWRRRRLGRSVTAWSACW